MATFKKLKNKFATKENNREDRLDIWVGSKEFWKGCKWFFEKGKKEGKVVSFQEEVSYNATGLVLGVTWEGFEGTYPSQAFNGTTLKENLVGCYSLILEGKHPNHKTLTGTGDFQKELGAILVITKSTTIQVNGKPFVNTEVSREFIGDLTADQMELLDEELGW